VIDPARSLLGQSSPGQSGLSFSRTAASPAGRASPAAKGASPATGYAGLDPKLVAAAHQFEASMMAELLKPLSSGDLFGGEEESGGAAGGLGTLSDLTSSADGSGGALMSFGSEALAKAISEKGGLGIARRVLDHFAEAAAKNGEGGAHPAAEAAKKTRMNPAPITKVMGIAADKLMEGERR